MSKKSLFLVSFVLVLGLSSIAQADAIEVNNPGFEYGPDGNKVPGHSGYDGVKGWKENYPSGGDTLGFVGVDVQCPYADSQHCHRWPGPTDDGYGSDVVYSYLQHTDRGANAYQVLDMNHSDVNAIIIPGRKYTLTYDALGWNGDRHAGSLFYVEEVCQPDVNHRELASRTYALEYIERALEDCNGESDLDDLDECPDWTYDLTVQFVAETGADCIGKTLGIKVTALAPGDYSFVDNFRLEWSWASSAYSPDPPDEGEDAPVNPVLSWSPGLWAASHEVYFGTSESEVTNATTASDPNIYRGSGSVVGPDVNNRYSYDVPETLELGKTYYWRIDEVNEGWTAGPVPPVDDRWKGDVWSFRTTGFAYNVYPPDNSIGIPALDLTLLWQAGTGAASHDVYFGTSESEVADANTATAGIFRDNQPLSDVNYPVETLEVRKDYFWRIDEVNTNTGTLVKGDVWQFTTGVFLIVDSFEWYPTDEALKAVWKDYWADTASKNGCQVFIETDPNFVRSGEQSMKFWYISNSLHKVGGKYVGSWATAATSDLEFTGDWTRGGVKALVTYFIGDPCNGKDTTSVDQDRIWVALDDGTTEGVVPYDGDMSAVTEDWWHEWNVSLQDFNDAGVVMSNVANVWLGLGGQRVGQTDPGAGKDYGQHDSVYFDDIRLYPPRCMPEITGLDILHGLGDITGPEGAEDCNTDYFDLAMLTRDWLMRGVWAQASVPSATPILEYMFDEGVGTDVNNTGSLGSTYDLTIGQNFDANGLLYMEPNNDPCWVNDADANRGWTLWFDGELGMFPRESKEVELGGDYLVVPPINLTTNTATITAWIKPDPFCILDKQGNCTDEYEFKDGFTGIIVNRTHSTLNPSDGTEAAGLNFGGGTGFTYNGMLGYTWNNNDSKTWGWDSDIFPVNLEWNFVAVTIQPDEATVYNVNESKVLELATNAIPHTAELLDARILIAGDIGHSRFYRGQMDDIRIYDEALPVGDIMGLAGVEGIVYVPCPSTADIVVGIKDPNDPNDPIDDQVDFKDYGKLAEHWLEQHPWP